MTSADYNGLYKEQSGNANTDKHLMFGDHDPSAIDYNAIYYRCTKSLMIFQLPNKSDNID